MLTSERQRSGTGHVKFMKRRPESGLLRKELPRLGTPWRNGNERRTAAGAAPGRERENGGRGNPGNGNRHAWKCGGIKVDDLA